MEPILTFFGEHRFLSNFFVAELVWDNIVWPSSEHAYQAAKTLDRSERIRISQLKTPGAAKKCGKTIQLRPDWEAVKVEIMYEIVLAKFSQNPELHDRLLATGDAHLEEGNSWHDRTWGVCPVGSGQGLNYLGVILMAVREELRACITQE
jgi:ribA/ribD-fused uncharacterized protein